MAQKWNAAQWQHAAEKMAKSIMSLEEKVAKLEANQLKEGEVRATRKKCYSPACDLCQADCKDGEMRLVEVES